jgi:hypothetical protein
MTSDAAPPAAAQAPPAPMPIGLDLHLDDGAVWPRPSAQQLGDDPGGRGRGGGARPAARPVAPSMPRCTSGTAVATGTAAGRMAGMVRRRSGRPAPPGSVGPGEFVVYPGVPSGIYDLLERLAAAAGDSPDFGTPGISLDRTRLTVRWFGEPPAPVRAVLAASTGFDVVVERTALRPGDLRREAERLVRDHPDVVAVAGARPEGDGIEVLVPPAVAAAAGGAAQALAAAGVRSDVPLSAEVGEALRG